MQDSAGTRLGMRSFPRSGPSKKAPSPFSVYNAEASRSGQVEPPCCRPKINIQRRAWAILRSRAAEKKFFRACSASATRKPSRFRWIRAASSPLRSYGISRTFPSRKTSTPTSGAKRVPIYAKPGWNRSKDKVGYEINFNHYFYRAKTGELAPCPPAIAGAVCAKVSNRMCPELEIR